MFLFIFLMAKTEYLLSLTQLLLFFPREFSVFMFTREGIWLQGQLISSRHTGLRILYTVSQGHLGSKLLLKGSSNGDL